MIRHETLNPPIHIYPINEWKIIETEFYPRFLSQAETLFAIGNGYLGMRGNHDEGIPLSQTGTFINGFHETWPIAYSEGAFGFAKTGQTMLNVTDTKIFKLYVDDEPFFLPTANLLRQENDNYEQHESQRDRTKKQQNLSLSSWLNLREGLSFDLNYGYFHTDIEQDLLFGVSAPYLFKDDSVDYQQTVHSITLGMTLQALENLTCRLEGYYIRSNADYSADFNEGPFPYNIYSPPAYNGIATSTDLKGISELDLRQNGLRGRANWQIDDNWSCEVEASYDKYNERNSNAYDGSVQTCMVSLSRNW